MRIMLKWIAFWLLVAAVLLVIHRACHAQVAPTDMDKALNLVRNETFTATAKRSGDWSDPATWDKPPAADGKVWIPAGVTVTQDVDSPRLRKLYGCPVPKEGATVTLTVDTWVTDSPLKVGTPEQPFTGQWNVIFADYGPIDLKADPWKFGRGAVFMGATQLYARKVTGYVFTTADANPGDTTISLKSNPEGWRVGDKLIVPGAGYDVVDDDVVTLTAIGDRSITVDPPLQFPHAITDKTDYPRAMFVANLAPRGIDFTSENPGDNRKRGHVMCMRMDMMAPFDFSNCSFRDLGRTDKNRPLTDPNGSSDDVPRPAGFTTVEEWAAIWPKLQGYLAWYVKTFKATSGVAYDRAKQAFIDGEIAKLPPTVPNPACDNERGRYALHFHRMGPSVSGMEAHVDSCLIAGSPGWGGVNHESYVCFTRNVVWHCFGAGLVTEIGNETGCMVDNVSMRPSDWVNKTPSMAAENPKPNRDWGYGGHPFFLMGGGVKLSGNIATGARGDAYVLMTLPFDTAKPTSVMFDTRNLPPPLTVATPSIPSFGIPANWDGNKCFGCNAGLKSWNLNGNAAAGAWIAKTVFWKWNLETYFTSVVSGYETGIRYEDFRVVSYGGGNGFGHTGVSSAKEFVRCKAFGPVYLGLNSPTLGNSLVDDFECDATWTAIRVVSHSLSGIPRTFAMNNVRNIGIGKAIIANMEDGQVQNLRTDPSLLSFVMFTSNIRYYLNDDNVTLDGKRMYYSEEGDDFELSNLKSVPLPELRDMTNGEMWEKKGLRIGCRLLPPDAVKPPNCDCYVGSDPIGIPTIYVNKEGVNVRRGIPYYTIQTNVTPFNPVIKDWQLNRIATHPVDLSPGWNLVKPFDDPRYVDRGVIVVLGQNVPQW